MHDSNSKFLQVLALGLAGALVIIGAFTLGLNVGKSKCFRFVKWSDNYGGHGVFGKVLSVSGTDIVVRGKDDLEQKVSVTSSTVIRLGRKEGKTEDLKADLEVAVFGKPNETGAIEAKLIRIFHDSSP